MTQHELHFGGLGIAPGILEVLTKHKFVVPTPIQHQSIPMGIEGNDVIGIAQTGTGKTLAFGIPMIQRLLAEGGNGLIIVPTRELALQVEESLKKVGSTLGIRTAVFIGGASMEMQRRMIKMKPHILVATPGRLIDHLDRRSITLSSVKMLVLDEADRMLDMGFAPQINKILALVPKERQTMLFSATMPSEIVRIARQHMKLPVSIEIAPTGTTADRVVQEAFMVRRDEKLKLLQHILGEIHGSVLVFCRTKHGAKKVTRLVRDMGHAAAEIHGNRSLSQRTDALGGFKTGRYRVLVATDIAARGIDVTGIELVINFDLPQDSGDYVHRIGRTGRAGREGRAISFVTPEQQSDVRAIERLIRISLPVKRHQSLPASLPMEAPEPRRAHQSHHPGPRGQQRRSFGRGRR